MFTKIFAVKCIVEEAGKILLIQESSKSSWRPGKWGLPGGKIDPKENMLEAVEREMHEETGLTIPKKQHFFI